MTDFAEKEFRDIAKKVREAGGYDLELILRVKNFKSQAPLGPSQSWESVVEMVNEAIKEADDVCASLETLCKIYGVGIPTASVLLAARYPDRFAIIDGGMFNFFRQVDAYGSIKRIFEISGDDELGALVKEVKEVFDEASEIRIQIYPKYLSVLSAIRDRTYLADLREVESKIWKETRK
ncbi:MAG TPA: hypothetical protein VMY40_09925 [Anaerolineae bacterium]|nr:hypothetical protein [Anaerolineae bacterium]